MGISGVGGSQLSEQEDGDKGRGRGTSRDLGRGALVADPARWLFLLQRGTYLPQTYIIQEEMVVTEHVSDKEALGSFIYHLCSGKDTYRLRRRATRRREWLAPPTLALALGPIAGDQLSGLVEQQQ